MEIKDDDVWVGFGVKGDDSGFAKAKTGTLSLRADEEGMRALGKRAHDVTAGLRTLSFAVESLRDGYRFDDNLADAKIVAMEKAVANLERECALLEKLLKAVFEK